MFDKQEAILLQFLAMEGCFFLRTGWSVREIREMKMPGINEINKKTV